MRVFALFALLASTQAFSVGPMARTLPMTRLNLMSQEETEALLTHATDCSDGECSLDEVDDLIQVLQAQQKELSDRVDTVKKMIKSLEIVNGKDDREVDEVRETIRALFRVFQLGDKASGNDYPSVGRATGWSGEVGKGPQSAYDVLPPKKWSPKQQP